MIKAFKYRLYPNKEQEILLQKTFGCVRFIYNQMLANRWPSTSNTKRIKNY
jgi:putative transposase